MGDSKATKEMRRILAETIADEVGLDGAVCAEIAFHLTDWREELEALAKLLEDPTAYDPSERYRVIQRFLIHATGHCMQASELLLGFPAESPFASGDDSGAA